MRITIRIFLSGAILGGCLAVGAGAAPAPLKLVQWSDIHYGNEEYRPAAWEEAWRDGSSMRPDVVVLTGDQVDNKCSRVQFDQREDDFLPVLSGRLAQAHLTTVMALGDNDLSDNYQTTPEILADTLSHYRKYFGATCYLNDLGNGVLPTTPGGMRWMSINSVLFSNRDRYSGHVRQQEATLDWLEQQLAATPPARPVVIAMHVPPVKDIIDQVEAWDLPPLLRFSRLLDGHRGPVYLVCGHFHRNEVHALKLPSGRMVPVLEAGSLSAKFNGFPNWRDYRWQQDAQHAVSDIQYTLHYPQHPEWQTRYDLSRPTLPVCYDEFTEHLNRSIAFYQQYQLDFYAHNPVSVWASLPPIQLDTEAEIVEQP